MRIGMKGSKTYGRDDSPRSHLFNLSECRVSAMYDLGKLLCMI